MQCEKCTNQTWNFTTCLGLSEEFYGSGSAQYISTEVLKFWFCPRCDELVFDSHYQTGEKLADSLNKLGCCVIVNWLYCVFG